ncbi:MAG: hypothetical protein ACXVRU_06125 [Gaiellaceae bacterium]
MAVPPSAEAVVRGPDGEVYAYGTVDDAGLYTIYFSGVAWFTFQPPCAVIDVAAGPLATDELLLDLFRTTVQPLFLQVVGYEALHASAVRTSRGVVAFSGTSGAGKSTLAYAFNRRGASLWADDVVIFDVETPERVTAHQLPYVARLREATRRFFVVDGESPTIEEHATESPAPLAAVVVLQPEPHARRELRQVPPVDALPLLLPHGFRFTLSDPELAHRTVAHYLELVSRVPVVELRFSHRLAQLPELVDELEELLHEAEE